MYSVSSRPFACDFWGNTHFAGRQAPITPDVCNALDLSLTCGCKLRRGRCPSVRPKRGGIRTYLLWVIVGTKRVAFGSSPSMRYYYGQGGMWWLILVGVLVQPKMPAPLLVSYFLYLYINYLIAIWYGWNTSTAPCIMLSSFFVP